MTELDRLFDKIQELTNKISNPERKSKPQTKQPQFLIAGLGNPGREYKNTRHNVGFQALDLLVNRLGTSFETQQSNAFVAKAVFTNHRILLVKPQTYMNKSGFAIHSIARFYRIPAERMLIVYDDVDLPLGKIRLKPQGGSGGHKGMKSIIDQFGTQAIPRLRIGIGRPPGRKKAAGYVLNNFHQSEIETRNLALTRACDAILTFVDEGLEKAMTKYNTFRHPDETKNE